LIKLPSEADGAASGVFKATATHFRENFETEKYGSFVE
jgi:hypothetical protein